MFHVNHELVALVVTLIFHLFYNNCCCCYHTMKKSYWLYYWLLVSYIVMAQDPTVVLRQGRLVGTRIFLQSSPFPIETFFGIPYATAPIGRHRFSAPERHPGWRRTLYAHRLPPRCPQPGDTAGTAGDGERDGYFNEDCLFLNICTPRRAEGKLLPVVVLLYSKSWSYRGTTTLPCQELAAEGLVVVSVAHRLHLLGFFSLRSKEARGNLALLDQYMAFMWIKENVAEFGGDPAAVTLLGHSAGADSVLYHMASPRAIGLFHRAVVMSPGDVWRAVDVDGNASAEVEHSSRKAARALGCVADADDALVRCMQSRPLEDIVRLYSNNNWSSRMEPVSEEFLAQSAQYLPMDISQAFTSKDTSEIEVLFGTTDLDAINYDDVGYNDFLSSEPSTVVDYTTHQVVPQLLRLHDLYNSPAMPALVEAVLWEYLGPRAMRAEGNIVELVEGMGRAKTSAKWGAGAALLAAKLARRVARLYVYRYTQPGQVDLQGQQINYTGAVHGTDLIALLGETMVQQIARRRPTASEQRNCIYLRKYFVNFIKFGSPAVVNEWPQYRAGAAYLHDLRGEGSRPAGLSAPAASREVAFWLQYLPHLNSLHSTTERTESLNSNKDDSRLRGAVYALVGVAASLLALLCVGAALLRRERNHRRGSDLDD